MYHYPILAGVLFGIIGLAYRLGQARGLTTPMVVLYTASAGVVFFGMRLGTPAFKAPAAIWVLGIAAGLAQYASMELVAAALARGPLSPIWCALNLIFVPVILYAWIFFGEPLDSLKVIGIAVAIGSVICGAIRPAEPDGGATAGTRMGQYLAILLAALLCNSFLHGAIKHLNHAQLMKQHDALFFFLTYLLMGLPILLKLCVTGFGRAFSWAGGGTGAMAATGSIGGFLFLAASAHFSAAIVFTLSAIVSLLTGSLISIAFFGEKITVWWIAMMLLAVGAVIMVSVT
ncbi:hypothetical protein IT570_00440 [Candidatus Sumerlaeota bacterium]|nr:hypothetical protein [Candidatus Sumerlaeota bacterium]